MGSRPYTQTDEGCLYLAYRFNRRFDLSALPTPQLIAAACGKPQPHWKIRIAEDSC